MATTTKQKYSDEELESILDIQASDQVSVRQLRTTIQENPLLVTGLAFTLGLLLGLTFHSRRKR
ncbi:MAG: hypothetical protein ABSD49_10315 [Candidatus Bathyarchaeia archaeon]